MDLSRAIWRKSSRSQGGNNNCVEVASGFAGTIAVRDSKEPAGPVLAVTPGAWREFVGGIKAGDL
ncbi:DUF397 domain-containing protein [Sphaerisporangium sp. NPDC051017]|uniref:DUF397 domain-containing protein n=1 Tax=Sphaerisporangium sp. NPDC051017 TaxID=3154636 RepID=UPI00341FF64C